MQEIYGLLLGHWAVRSLIGQTAQSAEISPLSLSFTDTLRVIRRAVPKFQRLKPEQIPFFSVGNERRYLVTLYLKEFREITQEW